MQSRELSRQDKLNLLRLGVGRGLLEPETGAKLIATEPRMEAEVHNVYKASTVALKFVAFKTALRAAHTPLRLCFTLKFFTFRAVETERVGLSTNE